MNDIREVIRLKQDLMDDLRKGVGNLIRQFAARSLSQDIFFTLHTLIEKIKIVNRTLIRFFPELTRLLQAENHLNNVLDNEIGLIWGNWKSNLYVYSVTRLEKSLENLNNAYNNSKKIKLNQ